MGKSTMAKHANDRGVRAIAIFKVIKGVLLVALASGALSMLQSRYPIDVVMHWVNALRFDPDNKHVQSLLERIVQLDDRQIKALSAATFLYAGVFLTEGVGLWLQKTWASYLTVIVTTSFIPLEIFELTQQFTAPKLVTIVLNVLIVIYLLIRLRHKKRRKGSS
jgi:uncharacterized membrane protein (DUF2068 family)